jgi:hypothetical protein
LNLGCGQCDGASSSKSSLAWRWRGHQVDRINRAVAIKQTQSGTVRANTGGAAEEFKAQDGLSLDALHAGDKITFSATETGGIKTITTLQNQ